MLCKNVLSEGKVNRDYQLLTLYDASNIDYDRYKSLVWPHHQENKKQEHDIAMTLAF